MRAVLILPVLLLVAGCDAINPALRYEEAARKLRFTLDRVEPRLELAFPLEQSRLRLRLEVGVDNPSEQRVRTQQVIGNLRLAAQGQEYALGSVGFPEGADIAAQGRSTLKVDISLGYQDLKTAWEPLSSAVLRHERAIWSLAGEARFDVVGIGFGVPFNVRKESGE